MGRKYLELCNSVNSLNWNEMMRLISSGDSACNPIVGRASISPGSSLPSTTDGANSSSMKLKNNKKKKAKSRSPENGYGSKIKKFLNPCNSKTPKKNIHKRLNELERKVNDFEKLYCNMLLRWTKDSRRSQTNSFSHDENREFFIGRNERKKTKHVHKADEGSRLELDKSSLYKHDGQDIPKKQQVKNTSVNISGLFRGSKNEKGTAKNRYTIIKKKELSTSVTEKEVSASSNISITADENGKYYFITSTAGYVKPYDEADDSSTRNSYETVSSIAKFSNKNLVYLINKEIAPRCIGSSHEKSNGYKSNRTNKKKSIKKFVSDKSTSTDSKLIDRGVNTKERYRQCREESPPIGYPIDIVINSKADTFETNPSHDKMNDAFSKCETENDTIDSENICFSSYPISSSCTSFSEPSENYIQISMALKK